MRDELKDRAIALLKDTYAIGYEDGVKATNVDCGVVWEERIDAIKQEIREAKSDNHAGGVLFIEQAYDICLAIIDEHGGGDGK